MIGEYRRLLKAIGSGRTFLFLLILRAPFDTASTLINALFLQHAFDTIGHNDAAGLTFVCLIFGVACLCLFLYNGTVWSFYAPFAARMEGKLRMKLYEKISSSSYERIEATSHSEWVTQLNTDVEMPFSRAVHLPHAACAILNICVSAVILWRINPEMFGWVMLFVIPHIVVSQMLIARAMPGLTTKSLEATAKNTGELTAFITCSDIAMLYDGQDFLMKRFEQSSMELLKANMRIHTRNALNALILPFSLCSYFAQIIFGGRLIADGTLTFGELTTASQYRGGVLVGAMMLINCLISIQASMAGIRRINKTMNEKTEAQHHG